MTNALVSAFCSLLFSTSLVAGELPIFYDSDVSTPTNSAPVAVVEQVVNLASQLPVYFKGGDNRRDQTMVVSLPPKLDGIGKVVLNLELSCPQGVCDAWDRLGTIGIISQAEGTKGSYFELMRFMTPYGLGEKHMIDVTDFMPLLKGEQTVRVFIDTWVGPGHPQGNGWIVDAKLTYTPGELKEKTAAIVPLMSFEEVLYGDPALSTERKRAALPLLGYKSAKFVSTITGHGQGNAQNCGEFCPKIHVMQVNDKVFARYIWRQDCQTTVNPAQKGTWYLPRAGWCPGDKVTPWEQDISAALLKDNPQVSYNVEAFENTCRPDAKECKGCVFNTPCAYDGGAHTPPRFLNSAYIIYKN